MRRAIPRRPIAIPMLVATAGLLAAAAALTATATAGSPAGQSSTPVADLRPICNDLGFNLPASVGQQVTIPTHTVMADPDVTPVKLVSVFGGSNLGTVTISGNDLVFTRTNAATGTVVIYWTISDGTLQNQCQSYASDVPPPDNG